MYGIEIISSALVAVLSSVKSSLLVQALNWRHPETQKNGTGISFDGLVPIEKEGG